MKSERKKLRVIGGVWRGRKITFLYQQELRPTPDRVRETLFNWLQADVPSSVCLDLFAGSGVLGIEAVSRGARQVVLVDRSKLACTEIDRNVELLTEGAQSDQKNIEVFNMDAVEYLKKTKMKFDIVFLDPPYASGLLEEIMQGLERQKCLNKHAKIYFEYDLKNEPPSLPDGWELIRSKSAGQVVYCLAVNEQQG